MASRTEADYLAAGEIPPMDTETRKRLCDTDGNEIPPKVYIKNEDISIFN